MTDQERRNETAEPGLLDELLGAAEPSAADSTEAAEAGVPGSEPQANQAEQPQEQEAEQPAAQALQELAIGTDGPIPVPAPPVLAEGVSGGAEASAEGGASYTPVTEEGGKPRRMKDLEAGMELDGRVTSVALYGIFVDIGVGRDGLVHISEMSDTRIDSPSDMV